MQEAIAETQNAPISGAQDMDADELQVAYHGFAHYIKPDMVTNMYSLVDFWMNGICEYQKSKKNLGRGYKDIKKSRESELHVYQRYLIEYVGLDLTSVESSYKRLDDLRNVRNKIIHNGSHVPSSKEEEFLTIKGIRLVGSLIFIEDSFIWDTLNHAKIYLYAAAKA